MPTITRIYTLQQAAEHNKRDDCWVVIDGKVYNVTDYLDEHPGGDDVLLAATGRDATEDFEDAGHSNDARELMKAYCIGELDLSPPPPIEKEKAGLIHKIWDVCTIPSAQDYAILATIVGMSVAAGVFYLRRK
ncbi:PREDICTED: cytochrome b5-like [Nelumbo nucifera]|uniref:Cytochrome b5-like n=1 Tax=Nelumbo nucifera TaxID=4432 RepID=A0A1U7ZW68_NELNU|nr:PREDICTED: cytochrome b5-like [Nelumbo nucifera]